MDGLVALIIMAVVASLFTQGKKAKKRGGENRPAASARKSGEPKIPYAPAPNPVKPKAVVRAKPAARAVKVKTAPDLEDAVAAMAAAHDEPEGSVSTQGTYSTQGERPEEHAAHRARVAAQEENQRREQEALEDLRNMRVKELRAAVVMSEVLGKPVALRRRYRV